MPEQLIKPAVKGKSQTAGIYVFQVDMKWDENGGENQTPEWKTVFAVNSFVPNNTYTEQPDDDFDSDGWDSSVVTGQGWNVAAGVRRKKFAGAFDAGQEFLRRAAFKAKKVHVRWFDRKHGPEAFEGYGSVKWEPQGGGRTDLQTVNVTITGDGELIELLANPHNAIPTVGTPDPATGPAGTEIKVPGTGFWNVSSVKFGGTEATSFIVDRETLLRAVVPAGSAGAANITVANPVGVSTTSGTFSRTV